MALTIDLFYVTVPMLFHFFVGVITMATQKKTTKKATMPKKTVATETIAVMATPCVAKTPSNIGLRTVLVLETGVLYFIILFMLFVWNNFTVLFFPK